MLFWAFILVFINYFLLIASFFDIPVMFHRLLPLASMLVALGIVYRILYKTREGEKEQLRDMVEQLKEAVDKLKGTEETGKVEAQKPGEEKTEQSE
ncbi:hypothetical protein JXI42_09960 [bacterium]|nr:hypothetical protein [bacterium]